MIHPRTVESSVAHSVEVPTLVLYRGSLGVAVLALVATLLFSCTHSTKAPTAAQSIDSLMTKLHEQGYFNGAVVVGRGDEIVYEGGFGYANVEERALFTPATPTDGASMGKTLTAAAIMTLKAEGRLTLDDPATNYLPELPYPDITVRHLITHGTGLPHTTNVARAPLEGETRTKEWILETIAEQPPPLAFNPGTGFQYSGTGFDLAAIIVERITGMSYGAFLRERFFEPLRMNSTFLRPAWLADWKGVRTLSYRPKGDSLEVYDVEDNRAFHGRGNIYWSAQDLYKWSASFYTRPVLDPSILASALKPPVYGEGHYSAINHLSWYYADGGHRFYYTGHTRGFYSFVYWDADLKHSVVYVSNNMPMWLRPVLARALIHALEGRQTPPIDAPVFLEPSAENLAAVTGVYDVDSVGRVSITLNGEQLYAQVVDSAPYEMFPVNESVYVPGLDAWVGFAGGENQPTIHWNTVFGGLATGKRIGK